MTSATISGGTEAHAFPDDMKQAILANADALATWENITPLARNEWICWTISVKTDETRQKHITRLVEELAAGDRRPCCWVGCIHRADKAMSPSQKFVTKRQGKPKTI